MEMAAILFLTIKKPDRTFLLTFLYVPIFECLVPPEIDHLNTGLVRYLDGHCIHIHIQYVREIKLHFLAPF
jgi:hypothetical protein